MEVTFSPTAAGAKTATLTIPSDDPDTPNLPVPQSGNGVNPLLTVTKNGTGNGTVTSSPTGISCGGTCGSAFPRGTLVTLQASPDSDSSFTGWSGTCSGTGDCEVSMNANVQVTATFDRLPPVADFTASPVTGNAPLTVNFTDQSLRAGAWEWTFGDGNTASAANPTNVYTVPGIFSVSLTVADPVSGSNTITKNDFVTVLSPPVDSGIQISGNTPVTYPNLQAAFDVVQEGEVIQCQAVGLTEDPNFAQPVNATLDGGYSSDYSTQAGVTVLTGTLTITDGAIVVNNLVIQ